jgi:predicted Zn-dependent peptidase
MSRADRSRLPDIGPDPPFTFPHIVRHSFGNGLQVRTVEHRTMPVVTMLVQVDAGAVADPAGREGLAALSADMLDEGTGDLSAIDVSDAFARIGAEYDADVGPDVVTFGVTTLERFAARGAGLLADLLLRPSLREADFTRVRQLRLDRLRQLKDSPPAVAERAFLRLMYGTHAYGHLPIGDAAALDRLDLSQVATFHADRFRPTKATVVVVGPLSHDGLLGVAESAFGEWSEQSDEVQGHPAGDVEPSAPHTPLAVVPRDSAPQSELRIGHLSARRNSPDYPALLVMNAVLGGQFVSRINLKLREEKGYTYGARSGFDWRRGLAPFSLQASVHTAATRDAIADCLAELEGIRGARPPSDAEMALAKASLTRGYPRGFETAQQVARAVAQLAVYGLPDTYFEEFVPRISAVRAEDVVRAAERYVDPAKTTTLIVGDYQMVGESLASLGLGDARLLPADG